MTDQKNTFQPDYLCDNPICRDAAIEQLEGRHEDAEEIEWLREALDGLLDAVDAHDKANGRTMVDPHATAVARAARCVCERPPEDQEKP